MGKSSRFRGRANLSSPRRKIRGKALPALLGAAAALTAESASAQQKTFHLDRLEMPGAPDDGVVLFRPVTNQRTIFFGQLGIGYQFRPLRTSTVTSDQATLDRSKSTVVSNQLAVYGNAGFQLLDRATLAIAFPWYPIQTGENPRYTGAGGVPSPGVSRTTVVQTGGPGAGDLRLDLRGVLARSQDRKSAFGAQVSVFFPSGTPANFGGDDKLGGMLLVSGETQVKFLVLTANTGVQFRPRHSINDPDGGSGLGIGNEWRWAVGAFIPLKDGKYRIGGSVFGQTGIESDRIIGDTFFTKRNTPIEFNIEGRMRFGPADHWWLGAGAGSSILRGYGAPDLRVVGLVGTYVPILESEAKSPERKAELREKWRRERSSDRDHDGIPDDIDACPDDPEDHKGNDPNDGCPMPPDRDGDGIPDQYDKCPDQPEDKDGIDDGDGCPEDDADNDGVPDTADHCPKMPGKPSTDPNKNGCPTYIQEDGTVVRVLQQVHFAFGTAQILPESFPVLQEVADYLKSNKAIKKMSIEGHTDNKGAPALNKKLSQDRANSVMNWLVQHGIEQPRLEAHGYGMEKPIEENDTDAGRAKNRRVEFKIVEQEDTNKVQKP
jgi:outer membrane protein OmpA-like peptidoglycan-associated protein